MATPWVASSVNRVQGRIDGREACAPGVAQNRNRVFSTAHGDRRTYGTSNHGKMRGLSYLLGFRVENLGSLLVSM